MTTAVPGATETTEEFRTRRSRVLVAAGVGQFVEWYDFAIYGYTSVVISELFFPKGNPTAALLSTFAIYGVAFVTRPLGGVFFGALGDRVGRRTVLSAVVLLMGAATTLIGLLPTYGQVGLLAPALLLTCRLLQGLSAGGESVGSLSFVAEHSPRNRRARWVNYMVAMSVVPSMVGALFVLLLTSVTTDADYTSWGWRIPFLASMPLALVGLYIRLRTEESPVFDRARAEQRLERRPVRAAFGSQLPSMTFVFFFASMTGLGFYLLIGYFVSYMETTLETSSSVALISNSVGLSALAIGLPIFGMLSDRHGRRPFLVTGAAGIAIVSVPAFLLVSTGDLALAALGQGLLGLAIAVFGGGSYTILVELFKTGTRYTGAAISYNIAYAALGGTAPLVATFLVAEFDSGLAPAVYVSVWALLVFLVTLRVEETFRISLHDAG